MSYIRRHGKRRRRFSRWRDSGAIAWQPCRALSPINKPYVLRKHLGVTYLLDMYRSWIIATKERGDTPVFNISRVREYGRSRDSRKFWVSFGNLPTIHDVNLPQPANFHSILAKFLREKTRFQNRHILRRYLQYYDEITSYNEYRYRKFIPWIQYKNTNSVNFHLNKINYVNNMRS